MIRTCFRVRWIYEKGNGVSREFWPKSLAVSGDLFARGSRIFGGWGGEGHFRPLGRLRRPFWGLSGHTSSFLPDSPSLLKTGGKPSRGSPASRGIKVIVTHGDLWDDSGDSIGFSLETGQGTRASLSGNCETFGCFNLRYFPNSFQKLKKLIKIVNLVPQPYYRSK